MPIEDPCDCEKVPAAFALDCQIINAVSRGAVGPVTLPPSGLQAAPIVFPQPFKLELVQTCDVEDPDRRPYIWDCP